MTSKAAGNFWVVARLLLGEGVDVAIDSPSDEVMAENKVDGGLMSE